MRLVRLLPPRLRNLAPEAVTFGVIGTLNVILYLAIFNATIFIGAVKATVIATVITTTLSYLANRHWTYRDRPRTALRREYALFFAFNLVGMLIQAAIVGAGKYGLGFDERHDRLAFNVATNVGIALATLFRFWAYRTLVFKTEPAVAVVDVPADAPSPVAVAVPVSRDGRDRFVALASSIEAQLAAAETVNGAVNSTGVKPAKYDEQPRPMRQPLVTDSLVSD